MLKVQIIFFVFSYLFLSNIVAQKEANVWMIERGNGIDFNEDTIRFFDNSALGENESSSSICDKDGNLLFYSNGITLYNRFHKIVKNGTKLGFDAGLNETTSNQGTLLLQHPDNDSLIYLFSSDYQGRSGGLVYAVINIYGNKDSGEVINKKNQLTGSINEPIIAVNHQNGRDIWIGVHGYANRLFHFFLLKKNGIVECNNLQSIGFNHSNNAQKTMKVSVDGTYIAHSDGNTGYFELLDVSNDELSQSVYMGYSHYWSYYEFSPNSKYIYYGDYNIHQFNIKTKQSIQVSNFPTNFFPRQLQMGTDGKIYAAVYESKDLIIIENPNEEGLNCNVIVKHNFFKNNVRTSLPNFNQSIFFSPAINYSYEMNCTKNSVQFWGKDTFGANSHLWQVRKGFGVNGYSLIGSNKNINYTFADTGTYEVRYVASNGNKADTVVKSFVLYDKIKKDFLGKDTAYALGDLINKTLFAPVPNHCVRWQDSSSLNSYNVNTNGTYICKVTNQAFCEVWDTIVISECINNLNQPSLFRSRDTLRTFHLNADSFVWYKNNKVYHISKEPFLALTDTGTYRVEAAKKGHCNSGSIGTNYVQRLNVNRINIEDLGIRVFPNPSNGNISIQSQNPFKLEINTVLGQTIYQGENINNINLPKGLYFLHFDVGGIRSVEKVVVW